MKRLKNANDNEISSSHAALPSLQSQPKEIVTIIENSHKCLCNRSGRVLWKSRNIRETPVCYCIKWRSNTTTAPISIPSAARYTWRSRGSERKWNWLPAANELSTSTNNNEEERSIVWRRNADAGKGKTTCMEHKRNNNESNRRIWI